MNAKRRKQITELASKLSEVRSDIETLRDEEQDYYGNMPESFQDGEKGEAAQSAITQLEEAIDSAASAASALEEIE